MTLAEFREFAEKNLERARSMVVNRLKFMPLELLLKGVVERFELGEARYGVLDPLDGRDWSQQELEELLDSAVYRLVRLKLDQG